MNTIIDRLVNHFDGQTKAAEAIGVDQSTVSGWVRGKHGVSPRTAIHIEEITSGLFTREELCPQTFAPSAA